MVRRYFDIGAVCSNGLRKAVNQDRLLVLVGEVNGKEFGLFAVADGVGGLNFGELASCYAISCIKEWWDTSIEALVSRTLKELLKQVDIELECLLQKLNYDIYKYGIEHSQKGGTTLSLIFVYGNYYILKHTGDSRIYMLGDIFKQLTKDQSWVESEVDNGLLSRELAENNPMKNLLTMCLGVFDCLQLQSLKGYIPGNAVIMLCSDGLYRYFNTAELKAAAAALQKDSEASSQTIANIFLERVLSKGAHDNISLIIVRSGEKRFLKLI